MSLHTLADPAPNARSTPLLEMLSRIHRRQREESMELLVPVNGRGSANPVSGCPWVMSPLLLCAFSYFIDTSVNRCCPSFVLGLREGFSTASSGFRGSLAICPCLSASPNSSPSLSPCKQASG